MSYSQKLRNLFAETSLEWEDLLLLETFQIKYLPDRVPEKEFAILIRTHPVLHRFLISKYPPITPYLVRIQEENQAFEDREQIAAHCQEALWEIADLIIYNKYPERFDAQAPISWELSDISAITSLEGKVVADVGAGSGRIAFLVASEVQSIYAIEPLSSFRSYMKGKIDEKGLRNMFVMDGILSSIPLPDRSLDILITSNAIGWSLDKELKEIERVIKPGGHAIHLLQSNEKIENPFHETLASVPWNYTCLMDEAGEKMKMRYFKVLN